MRYWVDGYNVIHRAPIGAGATLRERRAELLARIAASGAAAFVAFDSRERVVGAEESVPRRIEVAFARGGQNADQLLLERLRKARDLSDAMLVSDDRELRDRALALGVRSVAVAAFAKKLVAPGAATGRASGGGRKASAGGPTGGRALSRREVDDWMEWFGYERAPVPGPAATPESAPDTERRTTGANEQPPATGRKRTPKRSRR
jgi:hypothetical protein